MIINSVVYFSIIWSACKLFLRYFFVNFVKISENFSLFTSNRPKPLGAVAFFDSGIGGLSVLRECLRNGLCGEVLYYGDNERAPYGEKSAEVLQDYVEEAFGFFERRKVRLAVVACNTVTTLFLPWLRQKYSFPILGTYPPIERLNEGGFAFVTPATAESTYLKNARACTRERIRVIPLPGLAKRIERGAPCFSDIDLSSFLPKGSPNAVALGCTHYSFLREKFENFYRCPVYDSSKECAKNVALWLQKYDPERLQPPLTTFAENFAKPKAICPRLKFEGEKNESLVSAKEERYRQKKTSIFFAGSGKNINKWLCEQMFVSF